MFLSKSDFKVGRSCPTKLYYKKMGYPSGLEQSEYMQFLAEGGYVVGKIAQLYYPDGIEIKSDRGTAAALEETARYLDQDKVVLFEAAIESQGKLARVDILVKDGNMVDLIEVKSKSFNSQDEGFGNDMKEYLEDVAFQTWVLKEAFPHFVVHPYLLLPDKGKTTRIEGMAGWFRKKEKESGSRFRDIEVTFLHPVHSQEHKQLIAEELLSKQSVTDEVESCLLDVKAAAGELLESLKDGVCKKIDTAIGKKCFSCEYRSIVDDDRDGYLECWGELGKVKPHISELYYAGTLGGKDGSLIEELISMGQVNLLDIPYDALLNAKGELSTRGIRQNIQIENTRQGSEWVSPDLKQVLDGWQYPLHFIDFETSISAIPFHKGMRPYETIAFQWSCHTIDAPDAEPRHSEWINMERSFPNFRFARSLMEQIGETGTPLMWATHENTVLRAILGQMDVFGYQDDELTEWLLRITSDKKQKRPGRLVDMNKMTLDYYFHPDMKGRTSIKKVLPAVWNNNAWLHKVPWFSKYHKEVDGVVLSPYRALADLVTSLEETEVVAEGTAAMRAYYEIMYGDYRDNPKVQENWRDLLLSYCELDTMAMVIIWTYWKKAVV
jgi:hypothetical protein